MAIHSLKRIQKIPIDRSAAWDFFSNPANLQTITPPEMHFEILTESAGDRMYPGQVIEYRVRPLWNIPVYWMTEITHVEESSFFVDEQRFGPYSFWHHQHHFQDITGGVEMTDWVHYKNPLGFIGGMANRLLVRKKLEAIFDFRKKKIEELFGTWQEKGRT